LVFSACSTAQPLTPDAPVTQRDFPKANLTPSKQSSREPLVGPDTMVTPSIDADVLALSAIISDLPITSAIGRTATGTFPEIN